MNSLCMVAIGASKPKIPADTTSAQTEHKNLKVPIKKGTILKFECQKIWDAT